MSLILKGIDLPKDEEPSLKLLIASDGDVYKRTKDDLIFIGTNAQAIQIPTPHGRLIDADKVFCYNFWDEQNIDNAPTILEAEEE